MKRRDFLFMSIVSSASVAGCIEGDTQPNSIPIWVENQGQRAYNVGIECSQKGKSETIVSTELSVDSEDEQSVYAKPIRENKKYEVAISLLDQLETASITGEKLRSIEVKVRDENSIRINRVLI